MHRAMLGSEQRLRMMKNRDPCQLDLFAPRPAPTPGNDVPSARAVSVAKQRSSSPPTEEHLQAKLDGARQRLFEFFIVIQRWA